MKCLLRLGDYMCSSPLKELGFGHLFIQYSSFVQKICMYVLLLFVLRRKRSSDGSSEAGQFQKYKLYMCFMHALFKGCSHSFLSTVFCQQ